MYVLHSTAGFSFSVRYMFFFTTEKFRNIIKFPLDFYRPSNRLPEEVLADDDANDNADNDILDLAENFVCFQLVELGGEEVGNCSHTTKPQGKAPQVCLEVATELGF